MIALACLLLLASSTRLLVVDEVYSIPAGDWRYVELGLKQKAAHVSARYRVRQGPREVRLALLRGEDLGRLRHEQPHGVLSVTPAGSAGTLEFDLVQPGDYAVVVDNRGGPDGNAAPSHVHLTVALDFGHPVETTGISPQRRLTVIVISFAVFFGIVGWSAHRLLRAIGR